MTHSYKIIENKYSEEQKAAFWDMAIGLQEVDDLQPSEYLKKLSTQHIEGKLSIEQVEDLLYRRYEDETPEDKMLREKECDIVSNRIVQLLEMEGASFAVNPTSFKEIHRFLFTGIFTDAGRYRIFNISKNEPILNGESVKYTNYFTIEETLKYDMEREKEYKYDMKNKQAIVEHLAKFTSSIWQVHPFSEGNTRTTAVFLERYLNSMGFPVDNTLFKENAKYFRNALVRSNYADFVHGINAENIFLERFFENLLLGAKHVLRSRDLILHELF